MKSDGMVITGPPLQLVRGVLSPRKRAKHAFRGRLGAFDRHFQKLSALYQRTTTVQMHRCRQHRQDIENVWKSITLEESRGSRELLWDDHHGLMGTPLELGQGGGSPFLRSASET